MAGKSDKDREAKGGSPTIVDVARKARVSVGTVSNVLNGTRQVGEARRRRVLDAIEALGFRQNMLAHGLRRNSFSVVGLCVPLTSTSYFSALVDAFEDVASSRSFAIMQVLTHQDPVLERQRIENLLRYRVAGILLVPSISADASYEAIEKSGTPLVVVDRLSRHRRFDQVVFANRQAMYELGRQLIALGHRRILFCVQQPYLSVTVERRQGLNQAIAEAPWPVAADLLVCSANEREFVDQIRSALASPFPPSVIVVSNSTLAEWTMRGLESLEVRCPDRVSLVTFGEPDWADLVKPKLSVVRHPIREIAMGAWELLIRRMNRETGEAEQMAIEGTVILRGSVAAPAATIPPPLHHSLV